MRKSDEIIKKFAVTKIKRASMNIETWERTKLWDDWSDELQRVLEKRACFRNNELGIIAYVGDNNYWYIITTQRVIFADDQKAKSIELNEVEHYDFGDFKGAKGRKPIEKMTLRKKGGTVESFILKQANLQWVQFGGS